MTTLVGHTDRGRLRARLSEKRASEPVRPFSLVISDEGVMPPNAYFVPAPNLFRWTIESEGWHPLVLFVFPGSSWLVIDEVLRDVADERFYLEALPEIFAAWSSWTEEAARG